MLLVSTVYNLNISSKSCPSTLPHFISQRSPPAHTRPVKFTLRIFPRRYAVLLRSEILASFASRYWKEHPSSGFGALGADVLQVREPSNKRFWKNPSSFYLCIHSIVSIAGSKESMITVLGFSSQRTPKKTLSPHWWEISSSSWRMPKLNLRKR